MGLMTLSEPSPVCASALESSPGGGVGSGFAGCWSGSGDGMVATSHICFIEA
jgi:hypothetical protein